MRMVTPLCISLATPVLGESFVCDMDGTPLQFDIDMTQFAPPVDQGEPPRRRVSSVVMGDETFEAEPMVMGDLRGFWTDGNQPDQVVLIIQADGTATLTVGADGDELAGRCEVMN